MPVLWVPRIDEQIQLPIAYEVQLEGFVPVEHQVTGSHHRTCFVYPVALQYAVQVSQATTSCKFFLQISTFVYKLNFSLVKLVEF